MTNNPEKRISEEDRDFIVDFLATLEQAKTRIQSEGEDAFRQRIGEEKWNELRNVTEKLLASWKVRAKLEKVDRRRRRASEGNNTPPPEPADFVS